MKTFKELLEEVTMKKKSYNGKEYIEYRGVKTIADAKNLIKKHKIEYTDVYTNKIYGQTDFENNKKKVAYFTKDRDGILQIYLN